MANRLNVAHATGAHGALLALILATGALAGCGEGDATVAAPVIDARGKAIWEETCRVCHLNGIAGAPALGNKKAWQPRIAQGIDTLVEHALQGFSGSEGAMPPKGGNAALSDDDVAAAVRYMVSQSQ